MRFALALSASLLLTAPAFARDKADKPVDPDKKICRTLDQTGSMFTRRVCHTAEEWKAIDGANAKSAQSFDDTRNKSGGTN